MSDDKQHMDTGKDFDEMGKNHFDKAEIPYERSKEDVWGQLEAKIDLDESPRESRRIPVYRKYGIAAAILLLLGLSAVVRFYTKTIDNPSGRHLTYTLPDGSVVELNARSNLSYKPFWWRFSREVNFEGEGFFKVEKGKRFAVKSKLAKTVVLGTSFNIYAREDKYEVVCLTGKVKVVSKNDHEAVLTPGYEAKLALDGKVIIYKSENTENTIAWMDNKFFFTAIPLPRVFEEIERQYNVEIVIPDGLNYSYTGYFTRDKSIEEVLEFVCKPFGLKFVQNSDQRFTVIPKQ